MSDFWKQAFTRWFSLERPTPAFTPMRCLPTLSLFFKAHVLRSTAARVTLAVGDPRQDGRRFGLAVRSLSNSESTLYRHYWKQKVSLDQLYDQATYLARQRARLFPSHDPAGSNGVARVLRNCQARRPLDINPRAPSVASLDELIGDVAVRHIAERTDDTGGAGIDDASEGSSCYTGSRRRSRGAVGGVPCDSVGFTWTHGTDSDSISSRRTRTLDAEQRPRWGKRPGDDRHHLVFCPPP